MRTNFTFGGNSASKPRSNVEIMMTPMIDVVFLLLVFFLATSSFQAVEKMLPSQVSGKGGQPSGGSQASDATPKLTDLNDIVIRVKETEGSTLAYEFNGQSVVDVRALADLARNVILVRPDVPIIVDPDAKIPIGDVVEVYDLARRAGALRVYMATEG